MGRAATAYDIYMQSQKKMSSADLVVVVSPTADGQIAIRKSDPNQTRPFSATTLLEKANEKRTGRQLMSCDHQALCWQDQLRKNPKHAWKRTIGASHSWSGDTVAYMVSLTDDRARKGYSASLRGAVK